MPFFYETLCAVERRSDEGQDFLGWWSAIE